MPHRAQPAETRHADLASKLQAAITRGSYVVGSLLPTELELAESYGVSRQTVRTALQTLQDRGLISRKKGVGSRVENPESTASGYSQAVESLDDLVQVAAVEVRHLETVETATLDRAAARALEAPLDSEWICFTGFRVDANRQDRPLSWFRIFVDARFSAIAQQVREEPQSLVARLIERECGQAIEQVQQQVFAIALDAPMAAALKAAEGTPALRVLRHYKTARHRIVEITETIYPADRMRLTTTLQRNKALDRK